MSDEEIISASATEVGASVVTQWGAVIGLELLTDQSIGYTAGSGNEEGNAHA